MSFLSPEKLIIVAVVAVLVLGPDKLPRAARQVGDMWRTIKALRTRLEDQARAAFPELPPLDSIATAVRSPLSYLDHLAENHSEVLEVGDGLVASSPDIAPPAETVKVPPVSEAVSDPSLN